MYFFIKCPIHTGILVTPQRATATHLITVCGFLVVIKQIYNCMRSKPPFSLSRLLKLMFVAFA